MINLEQIQEDIFQLLLSLPQLQTVNIVLERRFIVNQEVQMDAVWQTPRNGATGNGILIEMPEVEVKSDNVSGPPQVVLMKFVLFQNGDAALLPGGVGGGFFAEQLEQTVLDALHLQSFGALGTLRATGKFSTPAREYDFVNARRLTLRLEPLATKQTPRTAPITANLAAGNCSLACATAGAKIYYTLDGSFPANSDVAVLLLPQGNVPAAVNAASNPYIAPFAVTSGQVIRAAAYLAGYNPGEILNYNVP
jgi:hypothetical protein